MGVGGRREGRGRGGVEGGGRWTNGNDRRRDCGRRRVVVVRVERVAVGGVCLRGDRVGVGHNHAGGPEVVHVG